MTTELEKKILIQDANHWCKMMEELTVKEYNSLSTKYKLVYKQCLETKKKYENKP